MTLPQTNKAARATTGYMHPRYASSFREIGIPRELPRCGGWIIERNIAGFPDRDAMGCYPLFACREWSNLHLDLEELPEALVSLALVTDPFGDYDERYLRQCFPDLAVPFKEHYAIDLAKPHELVSRHHRKETRRALRQLSVQVHPNTPEFLDTWMALHSNLVTKHGIKGIAAFSRVAFAEQLSTPGMVVFSASCDGVPVAATLYFVQDDVAHGHILGYTDSGYRQGALYALIWSAMEHFRGSLRWINLMGVPGAQDVGSDRIRQFKEGWTRETRTAWLCGRILNRERYAEIVRATRAAPTRYFPAYRDGEMARLDEQPPLTGRDSEGREALRDIR